MEHKMFKGVAYFLLFLICVAGISEARLTPFPVYQNSNFNQLLSSTNPAEIFTFDDDGNMTQGYTPEGYVLNMTYDAENRLKTSEYTDSGSVVHRTEYFYSGDSMLAQIKKFENGVSVDDARYLRNGFLPIQERNGSNQVTRDYTWGLNLGGGIGGLLNLKQGGTDYSYLYDGKGNVMVVIDTNQQPVASYRYDVFGRLLKETETLDQPYRFSTKPYDEQTDLLHFGYRFYSPSVGKWITRDPLGETGGLNLYQFVNNSPNNIIDPLGLDAIRVIYVGYPVNTGYRNIHLPLGHAAVIAVDPKTGNTRYYEYGRYGGDYGRVMRRPVPNLEIGLNGTPTETSLQKLYDYISEKYGKGYPVFDSYYSDADYQKVVDYAEQIKNNPKRAPYSLPDNTCYTFSSGAIAAGR